MPYDQDEKLKQIRLWGVRIVRYPDGGEKRQTGFLDQGRTSGHGKRPGRGLPKIRRMIFPGWHE